MFHSVFSDCSWPWVPETTESGWNWVNKWVGEQQPASGTCQPSGSVMSNRVAWKSTMVWYQPPRGTDGTGKQQVEPQLSWDLVKQWHIKFSYIYLWTHLKYPRGHTDMPGWRERRRSANDGLSVSVEIDNNPLKSELRLPFWSHLCPQAGAKWAFELEPF